MNTLTNLAQRRGVIAAAVLALIGLAVYFVSQLDPWAERSTGLPASFQLDLQPQLTVDPGLIRYAVRAEIRVPMSDVHGIATGADDRIYVAGDRAVQVFRPDGQADAVLALSGPPSCLAVAGSGHVEPGRVYAGVGGRIEVLHADGRPAGQWRVPGETPVLASLAVGEHDVFVADAASRMVWHFDVDGQLAGQIGKPDPSQQWSGFIVPSPYFDLALGVDGMVLHVVNPGQRQIATFSYAGDRGGAWGAGGSKLSDFFGCCNPAHFAVLPDGRFVTSEKGIPRIKVYTAQGQFECVVAGPEQLSVGDRHVADPSEGADKRVFDVAVDRQGRVLVLDPRSRTVRVYLARQGSAGAAS